MNGLLRQSKFTSNILGDDLETENKIDRNNMYTIAYPPPLVLNHQLLLSDIDDRYNGY